MTVLKTNDLPTFKRLQSEGVPILGGDRAAKQDIRVLHFGICNLMPDAALEATERQLVRPIAISSGVAQIHLHHFTLPMIERGKKAQAHIDSHYESFAGIQRDGLDGLIITGANTTEPITNKEFWQPMIDVLDWAGQEVTSTMTLCAATHVVMAHKYNQSPTRHTDKRWGVFPHRVVDKNHPLTVNMNTKFDVPHSRFGDVTREQCNKANVRILIESPDVGVHAMTSPDGLRWVGWQGHGEYDDNSLLKEFIREVKRHRNEERPDFPPPPRNYLNDHNLRIVDIFRQNSTADIGDLEKKLSSELDNTWRDSARSFMGAWIDAVYQLTNVDRKKPFMDDPKLDPKNPLAYLQMS